MKHDKRDKVLLFVLKVTCFSIIFVNCSMAKIFYMVYYNLVSLNMHTKWTLEKHAWNDKVTNLKNAVGE